MSKLETEFCDACGGILYHSVHSYHRDVVNWQSRWYWHGRTDENGSEDICADCMNAIGEVVAKNRAKVQKIKADALDKSPAELMEERSPLTVGKIRRILSKSKPGDTNE